MKNEKEGEGETKVVATETATNNLQRERGITINSSDRNESDNIARASRLFNSELISTTSDYLKFKDTLQFKEY